MPLGLPLAAHLHDAVLGTGNCALDEQQVPLGVDVVHRQTELRDALAAHPAGHLDALANARRRGRRADRAGLADVVRAVRARAGAEIVALDRSLEALADADAGDLDLVARLEDLDRHGLALHGAVDAAAELDELPVGADLELREVAELALRELAVGDGVERELHGVVAVCVRELHLHDRARACLDHRDRGDSPRLRVEDLRHAELSAEDAFGHGLKSAPLELDLDVDARREIEPHQLVDRLRRRAEDVDEALVRAHLEVLARVLVLEWTTDHAVDVLLRRQRDRPSDRRTAALRGVDDLLGRPVQPLVVVALQADPDFSLCHDGSSLFLLDDLCDDAGTDGAAALADREAEALIHGDRLDQLDLHVGVVARHDHLLALRELDRARHVRRAEVELRAVVVEERSVASALVLREDVDLGLEVRVRSDRRRLRQHLAALDLLTLDAAEERTRVVACLREVERLLEHLEAGDDGLLGLLVDAHDLDLVARLDLALLDAAGDDGAAARDRHHVLDRHQERLVDVALRLRDVGVDGLHELEDLRGPLGIALERLERRDLHDGDVVARELVGREQLPHLELDELEQLGIVDHVRLVQRDDDVRHLDLAGEQHVLARLGHGAVGGGDDEDRAVHLGRARDHVLDVVRVPRAVDVRVVTVLRLVLDMRGVDGDAALPLLRRLVDLVEAGRGGVGALL